MSDFLETFVGYADGASRSTRNLPSAAFAIFTPSNELASFRGIYIGQSMNNITEYSTFMELLSDAISHGICRLVVRLDPQFIILQLTGVYSI